jgi:uncharacterized membrane protein YhdT
VSENDEGDIWEHVGAIIKGLFGHWRETRARRLWIGVALIALGLVFWLLIAPSIFGLSGETGGFVSFMNWLGFSCTLLGIVMFFCGVGELV